MMSLESPFEKYNSKTLLMCGRVEEKLYFVPDNLCQLIISSPPYNLGKEYERKMSLEKYLIWQEQIISELSKKLKDTGSIVWQVGNYVDKGEVFPLDIYFYTIFKKNGFKLRNRIVWHFGHGLHASKRFSGRYETLLWFTKGDSYVFNLDAVRIPSKYPGKLHYSGAKKGQPSCNPLGKNPSDFWEVMAQEWETGIIDIPNVKSNHPEKTEHPCQFPVELVERCVLALTNQEDIVFDPFIGVGSSAIAAVKNGRQAIGIDKEEKYITIAKQRLVALQQGILKLRKVGTPIHVPSGREKVTQIPMVWKNSMGTLL